MKKYYSHSTTRRAKVIQFVPANLCDVCSYIVKNLASFDTS